MLQGVWVKRGSTVIISTLESLVKVQSRQVIGIQQLVQLPHLHHVPKCLKNLYASRLTKNSPYQHDFTVHKQGSRTLYFSSKEGFRDKLLRIPGPRV